MASPTAEVVENIEFENNAMDTDDDDIINKDKSCIDNAEEGEIVDPNDVPAEKPINSALALAAWLAYKKDDLTEKHYRLNALHMRGTEEMNTQDVFDYFKDYNPSSIEWINDYSCNVVWLDEESAAKALHGLSIRIKGLRRSGHTNPFSRRKSRSESSVLSNDSKDSVSSDASTSDEDEQLVQVRRGNEGNEDYARITDIRIPIPPGYWRKGTNYPKAKGILLRFATRADKKIPQAEKLSEYYKKYGNPKYGGITGLITTSRKRRFQNALGNIRLFEDDQGDARDFEDCDLDKDNKNPWGSLAQSWNRIDKSRSALRDLDSPVSTTQPLRTRNRSPSPVVLRKLKSLPTKSVFHRIGSTLIPVAKKYALEGSQSSESEEEKWTRKRKVPRMRMYADEVEGQTEKRMLIVRSRNVSPEENCTERRHRDESESDSDDEQEYRHRDQEKETKHLPQTENKDSKRNKKEIQEDLRKKLERDGKNQNQNKDATPSMLIWARLDSPEVSEEEQEKKDDDKESSSSSSSTSSSSTNSSSSSSSTSSSSDSSTSSTSSDSSSESDSSSDSGSETEQEETRVKRKQKTNQSKSDNRKKN